MTRPQSKDINHLIDRALIEPCDRTFFAVSTIFSPSETVKLAERVRHRATGLCRETPEFGRKILRARDRLILFIYASVVPDRAFSAWCDASLKETDSGVTSAISGLLFSPQGKLASRISQRITERDAVMAEAAAVASVMQAALHNRADRLRVHSDCAALVKLWLERRQDPRLDTLRRLAARFRWFELCRIPRLHNQLADRLAKRAMNRV